MADQKINLKYGLVVAVIVLGTWLLHEFSHWLTSESLGYDAFMGLNKVWSRGGQEVNSTHSLLISAAGPLITVLQAAVAFFWLRSRWNKYWYVVLFTAFYMRFLAGGMNVINLNDEGWISSQLGIGTYTLPLLVTGLLFWMVYRTSKQYQLRWQFQAGLTLLVMVTSSILIMVDQFFRIILLS